MGFAELYDLYYEPLFAYVCRHAQSQAEREALTEATFRAALKGYPRFRYQGRPELAWLEGLADRQIGRRGSVVALAPDGSQPQPAAAHKAALREQLLAAAGAGKPLAADQPLAYTVVSLAPLGEVYLGYSDRGACFLSGAARSEAEFAAQVRERYRCDVVRDDSRQAEWQAALERWLESGNVPTLDLSRVSPFERTVLAKALEIGRGSVRPYQWLARELGKPGASRAIGNAMARNPVPLFVPCHRVVAASGVIGNYSMGGPQVKRKLLELEGVPVDRLRQVVADQA